MTLRPWARRLCFVSLLVAVGALAGGCPEKSDLGSECRVMLPNGDGGLSVVATSDPHLNPKFDFVSTGDTDCENLICVRQAGATFPDDSDGDAHGICSTTCVDNTDCAPASNGLSCQQLSFDQSFLDQLQMSDPTTFNEFFGNTSTTYCVQASGG